MKGVEEYQGEWESAGCREMWERFIFEEVGGWKG